MTMMLAGLILILLFEGRLAFNVCNATSSASVNNSLNDPIYILVMVPFPDSREHAGWDYGAEMLPGARIARDYINSNRSDLLPGYRLEIIEANLEACGITDTIEEAYINLVDYAFSQTCGSVAAIAGLPCSHTTLRVSRIAGHVGSDLIQVAASGSPVFDTDTSFTIYPRLWRYVSSAGVYVDIMLELMREFGWKRVGLVQDLESVYYTEVAKLFQQKTLSQGFELITQSGLEQANPFSISTAIQSIRITGVTIIFVSATYAQSALLICKAAEEGLITPTYQWVFIDLLLEDFISQNACSEATLFNGLERSFLLQYDLGFNDPDTNPLADTYFRLYDEQLMNVRQDFNLSENIGTESGKTYGKLLFDQIWSFANALSKSIPILEEQNMTLANYGTNNAVITDILEAQLTSLDIQGLNGKIQFNNRVVPTPVRISYPRWNGSNFSEIVIGLYQNTSLSYINLESEDVPRDHLRPNLESLSLAIIAVLYIAILTTVVFVTIMIALFAYYKKKPEVKASSPLLRIFMFIGCYILCIAALLRITYGGFPRVIINFAFEFLCGLELIVALTGYSLIIVTLFIIQLRVHQIFGNKLLKNLSNLWKNGTLAVVIIILCFANILLTIVMLSIPQISPNFNTSVIKLEDTFDSNGVRQENVIIGCNIHNNLWIALTYLPLLFYLIALVYLSISMRRVRNHNFKDTKKINIFVAILLVQFVLYLVVWWLLLVYHKKQYVTLIEVLFPLLVVYSTQILLFIPKVFPICCKKYTTILTQKGSYDVSNSSSADYKPEARKISVTTIISGFLDELRTPSQRH